MPAGETFKVWYTEIYETIKSNWIFSLNIEEHFKLVEVLNIQLDSIRANRHIKKPKFRCSSCNDRHEGEFPKLSITALYYGVKRINLCSENELNILLNNWNRYSRKNKINVYGISKTKLRTTA